MKVKLRPIGELTEPVETWNPALSPDDVPFTYVDIASVNNIEKCIADAATVTPRSAPSRARQKIRAGDILVSTVRPNLNAVAIVPTKLNGATASTGFSVLRPRPTKLDSHYLYYWVQTGSFVEHLVRRATGASYPAVSDNVIRSAPIPDPGFEEQKRIVTILRKADAIRQKRRQALVDIDALLRATFLDMFGDPRINPKDLPSEPLGKHIKVKSGEFLPAREMDENGSVPVYGGNGISGHHSTALFQDSKIVIGRVGVYCGVIHVTSGPSWITDNALYVSQISSDLNFDYLAAALKFAKLNQYANQAAQPLISGSRIYPVEILVPPRDSQTSFARAKVAFERTEVQLSEMHRQAGALFGALSQRAFLGLL